MNARVALETCLASGVLRLVSDLRSPATTCGILLQYHQTLAGTLVVQLGEGSRIFSFDFDKAIISRPANCTGHSSASTVYVVNEPQQSLPLPCAGLALHGPTRLETTAVRL